LLPSSVRDTSVPREYLGGINEIDLYGGNDRFDFGA